MIDLLRVANSAVDEDRSRLNWFRNVDWLWWVSLKSIPYSIQHGLDAFFKTTFQFPTEKQAKIEKIAK